MVVVEGGSGETVFETGEEGGEDDVEAEVDVEMADADVEVVVERIELILFFSSS